MEQRNDCEGERTQRPIRSRRAAALYGGFTYVLSRRPDMLKKEFFPGFPEIEVKTKNLVWDMHIIEELGWDYFAKLELNQPYAIQSQPEDVPLAGAGTFQNRRVELTWVGLSGEAVKRAR